MISLRPMYRYVKVLEVQMLRGEAYMAHRVFGIEQYTTP